MYTSFVILFFFFYRGYILLRTRYFISFAEERVHERILGLFVFEIFCLHITGYEILPIYLIQYNN